MGLQMPGSELFSLTFSMYNHSQNLTKVNGIKSNVNLMT